MRDICDRPQNSADKYKAAVDPYSIRELYTDKIAIEIGLIRGQDGGIPVRCARIMQPNLVPDS